MSNFDVLGPDGQVLTTLNERLAERQKVTDEQLEALKTSHQLRWLLFEAARKVTHEPLKLKLLAAVFDTLETEQQRLWNFELNPNYHHFYELPGCTCPKMDNHDALGTPYRIYAGDCPIHWEAE